MSPIFSSFSLPPLASGSLYYAFDHSDLMGQGIVILLTLMSIATWTLMLEKGNVSRTHIDDYLRERHIEPVHLLEVSTMDLLIDFARIGLGAGCVIKNFVEDELQSGVFVEIPMDPPIPRRTIGFVSNSQSFHSKALDMFIKFYRHFYGKAF